MKGSTQRKLEIWLTAGLAMLVGFSLGYYWAAATAAAMVKAYLVSEGL